MVTIMKHDCDHNPLHNHLNHSSQDSPRSPPYLIQPSIAADRKTTVSYGLSSAFNHLTINYEQTTYFTQKLHRMSHACGEL
ncbi:hypothetical protein Bpfe_024048 [Biomphalaria pfeifferi]|uniref:Uncharacterized protein n=1 Tax=Biomphalaria pfeifferi TaxID=112525 RepID=A0AAD8B4M4_BIOPF|nr:hypothetical protein Bpfe_024048 [Biomphalaria pfeifferi]